MLAAVRAASAIAFLWLGGFALYLIVSVMSVVSNALKGCLRPLIRPFLAHSQASVQAAKPIACPDAYRGASLTVENVDGISTELLTWEPKQEAKVTLVMFPGNPGAVEFYSAFLGKIFTQSAAAGYPLKIVCVGHASHSKRTASKQRFNLTEQVSHKTSFVDSILRQNPTTQLVLAGHSVGAHMAIEVARNVPSSSLLRVVLLFPTVRHIGSTRNGVSLTPVFRFGRDAAWFFTHAIAALPSSVQNAILSPFLPGADQGAKLAALSLVHPDVAYNALWMALHEMQEIKEVDRAHLARIEKKCFFYFAERDDWVGDDDPTFLREVIPSARVHVCSKGHKHAFVLSTQSSHSVGESVWEDLEAVLSSSK